MPLTNCKIELKLKWKKYCVLSGAGNNNANNDNANDITFTIKDTKLYVPIVTLSARGNKKLSELLSKGFKRLVYWNEYKTKSENKNITNEYRYFLKSNLVGVTRLFVLSIQIKMIILKDLKLKNIIYQKELMIIITSSSMGKPLMAKQLIRR